MEVSGRGELRPFERGDREARGERLVLGELSQDLVRFGDLRRP